MIGAAALTYSVIDPFNVGMFITEAIWTLIGLFGVIKIFLKRRKVKAEQSTTDGATPTASTATPTEQS